MGFRKHRHHHHHWHHHRHHGSIKSKIAIIIFIFIIFFIAILLSNGNTSESITNYLPYESNIDYTPLTLQIEQAIFKHTNEERKSAGISLLKLDTKLSDIARAHSEDMAANDFFAHTNLKGEDPTERAIKKGYNVHKELGGGWYSDGIAENIGKMPTGNVEGVGYISRTAESIARAQVDSWMDSPGHRANILNSRYDIIGIGVAYDGHLYYISTQNFK